MVENAGQTPSLKDQILRKKWLCLNVRFFSTF